jgi:hypothetical protein
MLLYYTQRIVDYTSIPFYLATRLEDLVYGGANMAKGVLWVSSRVTKTDKLSPQKFCNWYENVRYLCSPTRFPMILNLDRYTSSKFLPYPVYPAQSDMKLYNHNLQRLHGVVRHHG